MRQAGNRTKGELKSDIIQKKNPKSKKKPTELTKTSGGQNQTESKRNGVTTTENEEEETLGTKLVNWEDEDLNTRVTTN